MWGIALRACGLAAALSVLTAGTGWALTAYVIDFSADDGAFAIDPSTIQDSAPGHRTADYYQVFEDYDVQIAKMDFDCAGRQVSTLSEKSYNAKDNGLDFVSDMGSLPATDFKPGTILEAMFVFVCGWPQVSSDAVKVDPDPEDITKLVIRLSNAVMDAQDAADSKQSQPQQ